VGGKSGELFEWTGGTKDTLEVDDQGPEGSYEVFFAAQRCQNLISLEKKKKEK